MVAATDEIVEPPPAAGFMFFTFTGSDAVCAGATAVLDILDAERLVERCATMGDVLAARLDDGARRPCPRHRDPRPGPVPGIELTPGGGRFAALVAVGPECLARTCGSTRRLGPGARRGDDRVPVHDQRSESSSRRRPAHRDRRRRGRLTARAGLIQPCANSASPSPELIAGVSRALTVEDGGQPDRGRRVERVITATSDSSPSLVAQSGGEAGRHAERAGEHHYAHYGTAKGTAGGARRRQTAMTGTEANCEINNGHAAAVARSVEEHEQEPEAEAAEPGEEQIGAGVGRSAFRRRCSRAPRPPWPRRCRCRRRDLGQFEASLGHRG